MKFIKQYNLLLVLFVALGFTACSDVEPIDPAIIIPTSPNPSNPSNPSNPGTSTGDYWPSALNNEWIFERNNVEQPPMKMVSINSINGNTYYTFDSQSGTSSNGITGGAVTRLRKSGGDYYMRVEDILVPSQTGSPASTTSGNETILLKDNLPVGGTWTSSYTQTTTFTGGGIPDVSIDFVITGTIEEIGSTIVVNGVTYTDVIKSKYVQSMDFMGQQSDTVTYYWFAKDIGPVRVRTESGADVYDSELIEYSLN